MTVLFKILQVVIALSVLILIHEAGHFAFAKLFRIRVDKFFLFFDAGGVKLFSTKTSKWFTRIFPGAADAETEYGIGWLPLGGYCKINGMIDESMDFKSMQEPPKPWEFRSKKVWQRLLVMAGGVLFNFIFAILVYIGILYIWGDTYISNRDNSIYVNELAYDMGFRNGDRILKFDDYSPEDFSMLQADLARRDVRKATVLRNGDTTDIYIDQSMIGAVLNSPGMFDLAVPFVIDTVPAVSANAGAGLMHGDRIASIDGINVPFVQDSRRVLPDYSGCEVTATVLRGTDTLSMQLQVDSSGMLGVYTMMPSIDLKSYSFGAAIPAGFRLTFDNIGGYVRDLKLVFTPRTEAYKSVGSFISIGQIFPSKWNWYQFMNILAILSIMLGVMNLLPIPALDGGHIAFGFFELFTGRKPGDRFMEVAQIVGMLLLLGLMMLACGNDIGRLLK